MILRVNPNRMELLRLRRRLALAIRGHKLLQDKLEEMMRRFMSMLKELNAAKEDFEKRYMEIFKNLLYCRITSSKSDFEHSLSGVSYEMDIDVSAVRIMNVKVPRFAVKKLSIEKHYDFFKTSAELDMAVYGAPKYIHSLLKIAELVKALDILAYEIERTRRRVNALEYILIPSIKDAIRYITQKLNEFERSNLTRLMRVKELIEAR